MIAVDTNVLLRYPLNDDAAQADTAASLIKGGDAVLITDVVLAETLWTLSGKKYRLTRINWPERSMRCLRSRMCALKTGRPRGWL
ncbi:MAG: hypothetical protein OXI02_03110 [Candidatus Dadabacteria bacterium]|nr:hypothetical protein [Candidatus Dadabacteria bacterium]MDE0477039.1 hypothetical protein [Candidatus Dadabacteria bacterium]